MISPTNPILDTLIFSILLGLAILISLRRRKDSQLFPISVTQELKGFAILTIVFAHIGYSLSTSDELLWPLSNLAGVGVNIFLFVSGYGLTSSNLRRKLSIRQFYARRLKKLYIPFWITIGLYLILDYVFLQRSYPLDYIAHSFAGIFQTADVSNDLNSPLWYFTLIAFYYLLYPLVFIKKHAWLSALFIFGLTIYLLNHTWLSLVDTVRLYEVYTVAFPLGIVTAWMHHNKSTFITWTRKNTKQLKKPALRNTAFYRNNLKMAKRTLYYASILSLVILFVYARAYSGPDDGLYKEQAVNVISMIIVILFFLLKRIEVKLFYVFGVFSYEIYLLHWPILSRYDALFPHLPVWLAIVLYLIVFLVLGRVLGKISALSSRDTKFLKKAP